MRIHSYVEIRRLLNQRTDCPVRVYPMHGHSARIVMRGQHMRAGDVGGDVNWPRKKRRRLAEKQQCARVWVDAERAHAVPVTLGDRISGESGVAGTAVTPCDVEELPGRVRPRLLNVPWKRHGTLHDQRAIRDVHPVLRELVAHGSIERYSARIRILASGR